MDGGAYGGSRRADLFEVKGGGRIATAAGGSTLRAFDKEALSVDAICRGVKRLIFGHEKFLANIDGSITDISYCGPCNIMRRLWMHILFSGEYFHRTGERFGKMRHSKDVREH